MSSMFFLMVSIFMIIGALSASDMTGHDDWRLETDEDYEAIELELAKLTKNIEGSDGDFDLNDYNSKRLYQNDIMLTFEQEMEMMNGVESNETNKRAGLDFKKFPRFKWAMPIKYSFNQTSYNEREKDVIRSGIKMWSKVTCVQFEEDSLAEPRIQIGRDENVCWSYVGMSYKQSQPLSLGDGCVHSTTAAHEFGHALGLQHEQTRVDRATVLTIEIDNVNENMTYNYKMNNPDHTTFEGLPYDMGSVMHYSADAFLDSDDGGSTVLSALNPLMQTTMGSNVGPSFTDARLINAMYCENVCENATVVCENGGYPSVKDCSRCACPEGMGGRTCNQVATSDINGCGYVSATSEWKSKTFDRVGRNENCYHKIESTDGDHVEVYVAHETSILNYGKPCMGYLEIKTGNFTVAGVRWCLKEDQPTEVMRANGPMAFVIHRTVERVAYFNTGYTMFYRSVAPNSPKTTEIPKKTVVDQFPLNDGFERNSLPASWLYT